MTTLARINGYLGEEHTTLEAAATALLARVMPPVSVVEDAVLARWSYGVSGSPTAFPVGRSGLRTSPSRAVAVQVVWRGTALRPVRLPLPASREVVMMALSMGGVGDAELVEGLYTYAATVAMAAGLLCHEVAA